MDFAKGFSKRDPIIDYGGLHTYRVGGWSTSQQFPSHPVDSDAAVRVLEEIIRKGNISAHFLDTEEEKKKDKNPAGDLQEPGKLLRWYGSSCIMYHTCFYGNDLKNSFYLFMA